MDGPAIIVRSISARTGKDAHGNPWQYHPRSDHHSKVSCWAILFDVLQNCPLLVSHVKAGKVAFGINHPLNDFASNKQKKLDLVLCQPREGAGPTKSFRGLAGVWGVALDPLDQAILAGLPDIPEAPVGALLMALEAKACMTEHKKAVPRLHDELNSSMRAINGSNGHAIAAGLTMVNQATTFVSPLRNGIKGPPWTVNRHNQPDCAIWVREKAILTIPRRSVPNQPGFDALGMIVVDAKNDGTPITLVSAGPVVPGSGTTLDYAYTILRICADYQARFTHI